MVRVISFDRKIISYNQFVGDDNNILLQTFSFSISLMNLDVRYLYLKAF